MRLIRVAAKTTVHEAAHSHERLFIMLWRLFTLKKSDRLKPKKKRLYRIEHEQNHHKQMERYNAPITAAFEASFKKLLTRG